MSECFGEDEAMVLRGGRWGDGAVLPLPYKNAIISRIFYSRTKSKKRPVTTGKGFSRGLKSHEKVKHQEHSNTQSLPQ